MVGWKTGTRREKLGTVRDRSCRGDVVGLAAFIGANTKEEKFSS